MPDLGGRTQIAVEFSPSELVLLDELVAAGRAAIRRLAVVAAHGRGPAGLLLADEEARDA